MSRILRALYYVGFRHLGLQVHSTIDIILVDYIIDY